MPDINSYNAAKELGAKKDSVMAAMSSTAITSQFNDKSHAINTVGKYAGKLVWNSNTGLLVVANGPLNTDLWKKTADGTTAHTPV